MPSSSRASIPPLSRSRTSSRPSAQGVLHAVWQRPLIVGAALALLLSLPELVLLLSQADGEIPAGAFRLLLLSCLFSMALAGLLFGALGPLLYLVCQLHPRLRHAGRILAAAVTALLAIAYVALRGAAEAFRWTSGSRLNLGTLEFLSASWDHLVLPVLGEYVGLVLILVVFSGACGGAAFLFTARLPKGSIGALPLFARGGAALAGFVGLVHVLSTPGMTIRCGLHQTADLALMTSIAARSAEAASTSERKVGIEIPAGAPLVTGDLWMSSARRLEGPRPNFILIMMESVGAGHLGASRGSRRVTPHLDDLSAASLRFTQARSTASHSNYAQMAVLSSLFPRRYTGLDTYKRLDYPRVLWHDFLTPLGYATATFSSQDETWQGMFSFQKTATPTHYRHAGNYEGKHLRIGAELTVPDEVTVRRAMEWIGAQKTPFGLYVNFQSTHFPYKIPEAAERPFLPERPTRGKYHYLHYPKNEVGTVKNRYENALSYVDAQVGRLVEYLRVTGRLDDTVLVVTSDHGELFWDHGMVTHGRTLFDAEIHVPLFVHYPARLAAGEVSRPVSTLDVLPTLATLLEVAPHPAFQGTSLLERADPNRPVFMNIQGMKSKDAVVCGDKKLIIDRATLRREVFDLARDPGETRDISLEHPEATEKLALLLAEQMRMQVAYHAPTEAAERTQRFAPRFGSCPRLDGGAPGELDDSGEPSSPGERTPATNASAQGDLAAVTLL